MLVLACGSDKALLDRVRANFAGEVKGETKIEMKHEMKIVEQVGFDQAMEVRADTILCIEPIRQAGVPQTEAGSLESVVKAAEALSVSRVVVVTNRVDTDGELRRLRRSGARYVIVRPPLVLDGEALRGKRMLVPRELAAVPLVSTDDLIRAITDVLRDGTVMGQTIDVPPTGLPEFEAAGAKLRVVAPWRVKVGRWLKQPVLAM